MPSTREARVLNEVIEAVVNKHIKHVIHNKFVIGMPIGASVLEMVIKTTIRLYGSKETKEELNELEKSHRATLGRVLRLFKEKVLFYLPQDLQKDIKELNRVIGNVWCTYGKDWYEVLINWRNEFMHGAKTWVPRAFAVYMNYVCLIIWYTIPQGEYKLKREELLRVAKWRMSTEDYWSFYPP